MSEPLGKVDVAATKSAAESCRDSSALPDRGKILPQAEWFAVMARELWHFKVPAHIHNHTGYSERTCRAWAAAESEPPARVLALLLRTDDGPRVLEYIMRNSDVRWWLLVCQARNILSTLWK